MLRSTSLFVQKEIASKNMHQGPKTTHAQLKLEEETEAQDLAVGR